MTVKSEYANVTKLDGDSSVYFKIPSSIILDKESSDKRVSAFSFFSIRRGLDDTVTFTVNGIARWLGKKPDRHEGGINSKISREISALAANGYVSLNGAPGNSSEVDAVFNTKKVNKECDEDYFALVYLDELKKIIGWNKDNSTKINDAVLLVFSYLRMRIQKRRNRLFAEETGESIDNRRKKTPEAYDCFYADIADATGLSARVVSNAVDALNEMGLVYSEQLPRVNVDGKWKTGRTIFCNYYKRENGNLLAYGKDYYRIEVENKMRKIENIIAKR